jgi:hypothetical protein
MQKTYNLFAYALQGLALRPFKFLSLLGVYAWVVAFYASVIFFTSSLQRQTAEVLTDLPQLWIQNLQGGRLVPIERKLVDSLSHIRGIKSIEPRYWGYLFDDATGAVFTLMGNDSVPAAECYVGAGVLQIKGLEKGDFFTFTDSRGEKQTHSITGVFTVQESLLTHDLAILSVVEAQAVLGLDSTQATDLGLYIYNEAEIDNISRKIRERFPFLRLTKRSELAATYQALFSWRSGLLLYGSMLAILAFLILAWERASGLSAEEKKEIGILKAVGWQISDVLRLKLFEGLLLATTATCIGIWIAYAHVYVFEAPLLKPLLAGWSVLYPSFSLIPIVSIGDLVAIFAFSLIPYLAATLIPAWKAAITEAADTMR